MDWNECCQKRIVKEVALDKEMIQALQKSSEKKLRSEEKLVMDDDTAGAKLSLAYDALRELLESIALEHKMKLYNHECYTAFLKEAVKQDELAQDFDAVRKIRNRVNYYGEDIRQEEAASMILLVKQVMARLKSLKKVL